MIIGFTGKIGVGKTTTSEWFVRNQGFIRLSYADPIRKAMTGLTGLSMKHLTDQVLKEKVIPGLPGITPRIMMQKLGTDYARNLISRDFFIWRMRKAVKENSGKRIVIDDVRFSNEANLIRELGGKVFKLTREFKSSSQAEHISENSINPSDIDVTIKCLESANKTAEYVWNSLDQYLGEKIMCENHRKKTMDLQLPTFHFPILENLTVEIEKFTDDINRNWSFDVKHPDMVVFEEIAQDLSRENPIIFVTANNGQKKTLSVIIHHSIITKAGITRNDLPTGKSLPFNALPIGNGAFLVKNIKVTQSEIVNWAKAVKAKMWNKSGSPAKIEVGIPKI